MERRTRKKANKQIEVLMKQLVEREQEIGRVQGEIARCQFEIEYASKGQQDYDAAQKKWQDEYNRALIRVANEPKEKETTHSYTTVSTSGWWLWKETTYNTHYYTTKAHNAEVDRLQQQTNAYKNIYDQALNNEKQKREHKANMTSKLNEQQTILAALIKQLPYHKENISKQIKDLDEQIGIKKKTNGSY